MESELHQCKTKLDSVFNSVSKIEDEEILAHYSKYLCILVSGYIENCIKSIIKNYVKNSSSPKIQNYITSQFQNITNLKDSKLQDVLEGFSSSWKTKYLEMLTIEQKDALDSVVANRNLIAHGKSVGITYSRINQYYQEIKGLVKNLKNNIII